MNVKCRCCGKKLNKNDGIRLPVKFGWDENLEGDNYWIYLYKDYSSFCHQLIFWQTRCLQTQGVV